MGAVTPETCRVVLQWTNICILLHLLDFYSYWIMMHGTTSFKKKVPLCVWNLFSSMKSIYVHYLCQVCVRGCNAECYVNDITCQQQCTEYRKNFSWLVKCQTKRECANSFCCSWMRHCGLYVGIWTAEIIAILAFLKGPLQLLNLTRKSSMHRVYSKV